MRRTIIVALTAPFALAFAGAADSQMTARDAAPSIADRSASVEAHTAGRDTLAAEGPLLIVRGTPDGAVVGEPTALYRGRVANGATLTVNGEPVAIERLGFWGVALPLAEGSNTLTFTATGADGATETVVRDVTFDPSLAGLRAPNTSKEGSARVAQEPAATRERL